MPRSGTAARWADTPSFNGSSGRSTAVIHQSWHDGGYVSLSGRPRPRSPASHWARHAAKLGGPFGAANVADLVDVLLLHEYPEDGRAREAISLVREFAAHGKPVILGETAPLFAGADTWRSFLSGSRSLVDGYLFFYDGRMPGELGTSIADAWYAAALAQFRQLRPSLGRNGGGQRPRRGNGCQSSEVANPRASIEGVARRRIDQAPEGASAAADHVYIAPAQEGDPAAVGRPGGCIAATAGEAPQTVSVPPDDVDIGSAGGFTHEGQPLPVGRPRGAQSAAVGEPAGSAADAHHVDIAASECDLSRRRPVRCRRRLRCELRKLGTVKRREENTAVTSR